MVVSALRLLRSPTAWVAGLLWALLLVSTAQAQTQAPGSSPPASSPGALSVQELEGLVATLKDDAAPAKLVAQLQGLITAQRGAVKEAPAVVPFFGRLSQQIDALTGEILAGAAVIVDAPRLLAWTRAQMYNPGARQRWVEAGIAFALTFGLA